MREMGAGSITNGTYLHCLTCEPWSSALPSPFSRQISDNTLAPKQARMLGHRTPDRKAAGWANRERHGGLAGRRIVGGMRRTEQGPQVFSEGHRAYVLVNNRTEGNAPLTVEGLVGMFSKERPGPFRSRAFYFRFRHGRTACTRKQVCLHRASIVVSNPPPRYYFLLASGYLSTLPLQSSSYLAFFVRSLHVRFPSHSLGRHLRYWHHVPSCLPRLARR
jgi:hypothetical protein